MIDSKEISIFMNFCFDYNIFYSFFTFIFY